MEFTWHDRQVLRFLRLSTWPDKCYSRVVTRIGSLLVAALAAHAQPISVGVKAGSPLNDPAWYSSFPTFSTFTQGRWTGGPTVEFHLPLRLSLEVDALYRSNRATGTSPVFFGSTTPNVFFSSQNTKAWDFPLLLKYGLLNGPMRPFLSAGFALNRESTNSLVGYTCLGAAAGCNLPDTNYVLRYFESVSHRRGPVAAAGIDFKTRRVIISPEVRFTRLTHPNTNQVTVMVGFTFKP